MDKIKFAQLVNWLSRLGMAELSSHEMQNLSDMVTPAVPDAVPSSNVDPSLVGELMLAFQYRRKIEAVKVHRLLTGYGLKESKDAVEYYWDKVDNA